MISTTETALERNYRDIVAFAESELYPCRDRTPNTPVQASEADTPGGIHSRQGGALSLPDDHLLLP